MKCFCIKCTSTYHFYTEICLLVVSRDLIEELLKGKLQETEKLET